MRMLVLVAVVSSVACSKGKERSDLAECFDLCTTTKIALVDYRRKARAADAGTRGADASARALPIFDADGNVVKCSDGSRPRCADDANSPRLPDSFIPDNCADGTKPRCSSPSPAPLAAPEDVRAECAELCISTRARPPVSQ